VTIPSKKRMLSAESASRGQLLINRLMTMPTGRTISAININGMAKYIAGTPILSGNSGNTVIVRFTRPQNRKHPYATSWRNRDAFML
jgi:hypothetical protein